jgi:hypothetical protein
MTDQIVEGARRARLGDIDDTVPCDHGLLFG